MADNEGLSAERPGQFGWSAWRQVFRRAAGEVGRDHLSMISAGVAFRFFLALFPAIAAAVSIYGLVADPGQVQQATGALRGILPAQVIDIMGQQMSKIAAQSGSALGLGAIVGIVLALWSANSGTRSLMEALDIAYNEEEKRGFLRLNGISLLLTVAVIVGLVVSVALVGVLPALLGKLPLPDVVQSIVAWSRWPLLGVAMMAALALFYRYAPSREAARWQWVSVGAVVATLLWLVASGIFSFYVSHSNSYNATYGSLAAIVILLMWFYISVFVVLFGAELNSEMERQTVRDTTVGEPAPLGQRAAYSADTVAAAGNQGVEGGRRPAPWRENGTAAQMAAELEETRQRLDLTLRALAARLSPGEVAAGTVASVRHDLEQLGGGDFRMRDRPWLLGAIGLAAGAALASALPRERRMPRRGPADTLH